MSLAASSNPANWLLSQPQLLFVLFAGAVWLFNMIARARRGVLGADRERQESREPGAGGRSGAASEDPGDEGRARRVRAEILRKIAERRATSPLLQPARAREERWSPAPPDIPASTPPTSRGFTEDAADQVPAAARPRANPSGGPPLVPVGVAAGPLSGAVWLDELRSKDTARRAILVREILGPPIALR